MEHANKSTVWPLTSDYAAAVQNPLSNFSDPDLQLAKPELTNLQLPRVRTGAFAAVFRMQSPQKDYAVRCFLRQYGDQHERYDAISEHLLTSKLPYAVDFNYINKGINVNGVWHPILRMDWVRGKPINEYVRDNLQDSQKLRILANQILELLRSLQQASIAHGDLQNGNLLVSNDRLVLIDYDGMYVSKLAGRKSHEVGHRNFQHPLRTELNFDSSLDNFSVWVIYVSLLALSIDPKLWFATDAAKSDEQLLFKKDDFIKPDTSNTFNLLLKHSNQDLQSLANRFKSSLSFDVLQFPSLITIPKQISNPMPLWLPDHLLQNNSSITSGVEAKSHQYLAEISRANPALLLFVFDQTSSSSPVHHLVPREDGGKILANIMNGLLTNLVLKCARHDGGINDYYHIAAIGYGSFVNTAFTGVLANKEIVTISELGNAPARIDHQTKNISNGMGGIIEQKIKTPIWIDPVAKSEPLFSMKFGQVSRTRPLNQALHKAKTIISEWLPQHRNAFPPIVINITYGEPTDEEAASIAQSISALSTSDGHVLVFNAHLSSTTGAPKIEYPSDKNKLRDQHAKLLFDMSSPLPDFMKSMLETDGINVCDGARGFVFNADVGSIVRFLDILFATRPAGAFYK